MTNKAGVENVPKKIYLNLGDGFLEGADFKELNEVTWCADKLGENDIEYVLEESQPENQKAEPEGAEEVYKVQEIFDDHKKLVRELDVIINGENAASPQASLCDIVAQLKKEYRKEDDVLKIDYENIPQGEVLLLTTSKVWIIGDWYKDGWRTKLSTWVDGKLTTMPKKEVTHYKKLPSWENL